MYVRLGGHTEPRTNRINPRTTCSHRSQRTLRAHRTQRVSVPSAATASCWHLPPGVFVPAARQHPHRFASHFPAGWPSSANNSPIFNQRALVTWPRPPVLASPPTAAVAGVDRIRTGRAMGDAAGAPLLVKRARYHTGCPGCRVDRRNEEREGVFPFPDLFRIWLVTVCSSMASSFLHSRPSRAFSLRSCSALHSSSCFIFLFFKGAYAISFILKN
jgi:hypothetical protein